jgi:hypothetical protein
MNSLNQEPQRYLLLIRTISFLLPANSRSEWRREWEAEITCRWLQLEKWGTLDAQSRADLRNRIYGAALDVLWFPNGRAHLLLVTLNMLVAALTAFGAIPEFIVRAFLKPETKPFLVSVAGIIVSVLFVISGIAVARKWRETRLLIIATGLLSILLHVYGALPPHRNIGYVAMLVGAGYGLLMLVTFEWQRRRKLVL